MQNTIEEFIDVLGAAGTDYLIERLTVEFAKPASLKELTTDDDILKIILMKVLPTTTIVSMDINHASTMDYLPVVPPHVQLMPVKTDVLDNISTVGIVDNKVVDLDDFHYNPTSKKWLIIDPLIKEAKALDEQKEISKGNIDKVAEYARQRYATTGSGQAAIYAEKYYEAIRYTSEGFPSDLTSYPLIGIDVKVNSKPAEDVASIIITKHDEYTAANIKIEEERLMAKAKITAAKTIQDVKNIQTRAISNLEAV